jgi:two-component system, response regulator
MVQELCSNVPSPCPGPASPLAVAGTFLRVLHVNDSTDDQVLFQAACRKAQVPFNWHVADSSEKGISYLTSLMEQSQRVPVCWPDVVLLDIVMPGASGLEVLKFVRTTPALRALPVVIFTGHPSPARRQESLGLGATEFLLKPSTFSEIVALAKELYELVLRLKAGGGPPTV